MASRPPEGNDPNARKRFFAINLIRLSGVIFVLVGLLAVNGKVDLPPLAGYVFVAVGMVDVFVIPLVLARRWRSPPG